MKKRTYPYAVLFILIILTSSAFADETQNEFEILGAFENAITKIVDQSMPAVVNISVLKTENEASKDAQPSGAASGFIFHKDGYILTNQHVIDNAENVIVKLYDGSIYDEADIVGVDVITDIAVLKIERTRPFPFLELTDSAQVRVGQFTIAIGHPMGYNNTVTTGIVGGKDRCFHPQNDLYQYCFSYIQTNAWINPGSSGGPLLNMQGKVIGITTLNPGEGATLAIESTLSKTISQQLITHGRVIRGYLDAEIRNVRQGIQVTKVPRNTAAQDGLQPHDIIVEFEGMRPPRLFEFEMHLMEGLIGKQYTLKVLRQTQEISINVRSIEMPLEMRGGTVNSESVSWKTLGLAVRKLEQNNHERYAYLTEQDRGVLVEKVREASLSAKAKIPHGALIIGVNGQKINDVQSLQTYLQTHQDNVQLILDIKSVRGIERITLMDSPG